MSVALKSTTLTTLYNISLKYLNTLVHFHILLSECYRDNGVDYRGTQAHTKRGTPCIRWADSRKHTPEKFPDKVTFQITGILKKYVYN